MIAKARLEASCPDTVAPLIRLRVDYSGFTTINSQRFGQRFVGKVANPHDILLLSKVATRKAKTEGQAPTGTHLRPDQLDQVSCFVVRVCPSNPFHWQQLLL